GVDAVNDESSSGSTSPAAMWGGRFAEATDALVKRMNASIGIDQRMAREDILGSLAHAAMLTATGVLSDEDGTTIEAGLRSLLADLEAGRLEFSEEYEDIHMNLEHLLTERIGAVGGKL